MFFILFAVINILLMFIAVLWAYPRFLERAGLASQWSPAGTGSAIPLVAAGVVPQPDGTELLYVGGGVGQSADVFMALHSKKKQLRVVGRILKNPNEPTTCIVVCALRPGMDPRSLVVGRGGGVYLYPFQSSGYGPPEVLWQRAPGSTQLPSSVSVADLTGGGRLSLHRNAPAHRSF